MANTYRMVSGIVFGLVAIGQAARAVLQVPVQVGTFAVPVAASWVAAALAGALCVWAFRGTEDV